MSSANITSVTSVTTPPSQNSNITLHGTGFGASQGTSVVYMFPVFGGLNVLAIVSWTATAITATIPAFADITDSAFAVVQIGGEQTAARSPLFAVGPEVFPAGTSLISGQYVTALPGTLANLASSPVTLPLVDPPYFECVGVITGIVSPTVYSSDWQTDTQGNTNSFDITVGTFTLHGDMTVKHVNAFGLLLPGQGGGG
jgi:hypothetical protein